MSMGMPICVIALLHPQELDSRTVGDVCEGASHKSTAQGLPHRQSAHHMRATGLRSLRRCKKAHDQATAGFATQGPKVRVGFGLVA